METEAREPDLAVLGRIPYDPAVARAQTQLRSVVEFGDSPAGRGLGRLRERVCDALV